MLNLHTEYSCTGDFERKMKSNVCFRQVFEVLENEKKKFSINYVIRIYAGFDAAEKKRWNNVCLLNKKELRNHINQLKGIIPFRAKILTKKGDNGDFYEVHLQLDNVKGIYHRFILTWIRYVYEFPYNVYVVEAQRLRKEKLFMFESIANLFNLIGSCVTLGGGHSCAYGHTIGFLQRKELSARLKETKYLNNIYSHSHEGDSIETRVEHNGENLTWYDLAFWKDEELFQKRLPVYVEKFKKIKHKKDK